MMYDLKTQPSRVWNTNYPDNNVHLKTLHVNSSYLTKDTKNAFTRPALGATFILDLCSPTGSSQWVKLRSHITGMVKLVKVKRTYTSYLLLFILDSGLGKSRPEKWFVQFIHEMEVIWHFRLFFHYFIFLLHLYFVWRLDTQSLFFSWTFGPLSSFIFPFTSHYFSISCFSIIYFHYLIYLSTVVS